MERGQVKTGGWALCKMCSFVQAWNLLVELGAVESVGSGGGRVGAQVDSPG